MIQLLFAFCISMTALWCSEIPTKKQEISNLFFHFSHVKDTSSALKILSEKGVNTDHMTNNDDTAVYSLLKILLEEGADINYALICNVTALHMAVTDESLKMVNFLLKQKFINVDAKMDDAKTALHIAAIKGNYEIASALIQKGADVNAEGLEKAIPLHYATISGHVDMIKLFIQNGVHVNTALYNGKTALHLALQGRCEEAAKLILDQENVTIDAPCKLYGISGVTALHMALASKFLDVAKTLIKKGAKKDVLTSKGASPLDLAIAHNIPELITLLSGKVKIKQQQPAISFLKELSAAKSNTAEKLPHPKLA